MLMILKIFSRAGISYQTYLGHSTTQGKEYLSIIDIQPTSIGDNDRNPIIDLSKRLSFQQPVWLSLDFIGGCKKLCITAYYSCGACYAIVAWMPEKNRPSGNHYCFRLVRQHQATLLERCSCEEMNMRRCTRCNKKRNFIERLFALDKELCDECLYDIQIEIRERREIPVQRHKD